jgi:putative SOS response-associated peptidase YedK
MCGRFRASGSAEEVARWFKTTGPLPNLRQRYNAEPTPDLGVVLRDKDTGERRLEVLPWGLTPPGDPDGTGSRGRTFVVVIVVLHRVDA